MTRQRAAGRTPRQRRAPYIWGAVFIVAVAIGGGIAIAWRTDPPAPAETAGSRIANASMVPAGYVRRETRPTLDPARFVGKAAVTHQIARDIPDVLDHLYCYCQCDKSVGHKSLLSCYTDGHAAT
ncbi:MAG: hypothetical protein HYU51_06460 [Candidatus Rokubacteria bacterium]|nr:hypothetical protein [Candidatus Rokubacteria bacterium]